MKQVRFFNVDKSGQSNYLGRVVLKDGKITYDTLPDGLKRTLREGLTKWERPRKHFLPKDGLSFLKLIPLTFNSAYLNARPIEDVDV